MIYLLSFLNRNKKYIFNFNWTILDKVFRFFFVTLINIFLARYLGPSDYGLLNYIISFVIIFSPIASFGIDNILIRELVKNKESQNKIIISGLIICLVGSLITIIISILLAIILYDIQSNIFFFIFIFSFVHIVNIRVPIISWSNAILKFKYILISKTISYVISSYLKIYILVNNIDFIYLIIVFLIEEILITLFLYVTYLYKNNFNLFKFYFDFERIINLLKSGWPLMISGFSYLIYVSVDKIFLGYLINHNEVGYYSVITTLSLSWHFIPLALISSIIPLMIKLNKESLSKFTNFIKYLHYILTIPIILISLILSFYSDQLILFIYGDDYANIHFGLIIHLWIGLFVVYNSISYNFVIIKNKEKLSFYKSISGALLNICLNFLFIPYFGYVGASIATLISYFYMAILFDLIFIETRALFYYKIKSLNPINFIMSLKSTITHV